MHHSIELIDVHIRLGNVPVLSGVNVEAKPCEFVAIVGANGAGKTTLLKIANGTLRPDRGTVKVLGYDLSQHKDLNFLRRDIGVVAQKSNHHRFPIRVEEAVLMGRFGKIGRMRNPQAIDREKAREAMRIAGILPLAQKLIFELSGGNSRKWLWPGLWPRSPPSFFSMSRQPTWTVRPGRTSWRRSMPFTMRGL